MYIKESYVYTLPADMNDPEGPTRWVACSSGDCGYERCEDDSSYMIRMKPVLLRMFKVNGQQTCEGCIKEWRANMTVALGWVE